MVYSLTVIQASTRVRRYLLGRRRHIYRLLRCISRLSRCCDIVSLLEHRDLSRSP